MDTLTDSYSELYSLKLLVVEGEMWDFLLNLEIPCVSDNDMNMLEAHITIEELQQAVLVSCNYKSTRWSANEN